MDDPHRLIEAEIPRLRRFARALVRDPDHADDLVQSCLERAIAGVETWRPGTNMRAWLFTILRNVLINEYRRAQRNPVQSTEAPGDLGMAVQGNQEARVKLTELQQALDSLPIEHREVILLVAVEGLRYEEAAAVLGVPIGTVRSRLSRGRRMLQRLLSEPAQDLTLSEG